MLGVTLSLALWAVEGQAQSPPPPMINKNLNMSGKPPDALPSPGLQPLRAPGLELSAKEEESTGGDEFANPFEPPVQGPQKTPEEVEVEIRTQSFNAALTGLLPMRPQEVRKLLEHFDKTKQAVEVPVFPYPEPEVVVETVSLDPGAMPPEIKLATGHVTTLNILDVTGAPWPIQDISWAGNFEVVQPEAGGHVVRISPMAEFAYGNISIRLLKLKTPISFVLKVHRDKVQYRFDARIPEYGPYAQPPLIDGGLTLVAGDALLNNILDGVPPEGAIRLKVSGADSRTSAYLYNDVTYVRTPLTMLSPGWSSSASSADGMNAYTMVNAPVLLLSDGGKMVRARLSEKDDGAEE